MKGLYKLAFLYIQFTHTLRKCKFNLEKSKIEKMTIVNNTHLKYTMEGVSKIPVLQEQANFPRRMFRIFSLT